MTRRVPIFRCFDITAAVDDEDYERASHFRWFIKYKFHKTNKGMINYPTIYTNVRLPNGKIRQISLAQFVTQSKDRVSFIGNNRFDCQKANLLIKGIPQGRPEDRYRRKLDSVRRSLLARGIIAPKNS